MERVFATFKGQMAELNYHEGQAVAHADDFVRATFKRHLPLSVPTTGQIEAGDLA